MEETEKPFKYVPKKPVGFYLDPVNEIGWVRVPRLPLELGKVSIPGPVTLPSGTKDSSIGEVRYITEEP